MAVLARPFATSAAPRSACSVPLRRCTFRLVTAIGGTPELPMYQVACTFPDRSKAIALGDIEDARPICHACTYQGIFRADSD